MKKPLRSAALLGLLLLGCLALGAVAQDGAAAAAATATGGEAKPAADAAPAVVPAATATASPAEAAVAAAEVPSPSPTPAAEAAPAVTPEKKDDGDAAALAKAAESAAKAATAAAEAATAAVAAAGAAKAADDKKTEELKKPDAAPTAAANTTVKAEAADPVDKPAEPAKPADEKKETAVAATITAPVATPKVAAGKPATPTQEDDEEAEEEDDDDDDDKEDKKAKKRANKKQRAKKEAFTNKVVDFAPSVNVTFGDDIDDEGKCSKEIAKYCDDVDEGEGKLADCISENIAATELPDATDDVPEISDDCREEVYSFKITRNSNINGNIPLAKACKVDAEKFCNVTWFFGYKSGQVLSCLRDVKAQVAKPCKQQLFKIQIDAAIDFRADPMLYEACKDDSESLCKGIKNGGGRIQACLRDKRMQLSWACEEQLFRQEMENADDIRLSVRLYSKCLPDKRKFCKDIQPGNARTKDCLEDHREELSSSCKDEVDAMVERRVRDFRLDSRLRTACENEIFNMCAYFGDLDDIDTYDSSVINCLQDYASEIKSTECKSQVKKYVQLASQDIRFDVPLAEACYEDRQKFCTNVPPGSARVIRCLSNSRDSLSPVCRATLFDEEVRFSENIDFQYPMKAACGREIERFCKDVPHGNARVIRCLQDNKEEKDFGKACSEEVRGYEAEISKDYRLNFRLHKACEKDVDKLCPGLCQNSDGSTCGGKVLRCLTDKMEDIGDEACRKEVYYFEKMEVSNFKNDILLAEACHSDVDKFCNTIEPGEGRVHKCLRDNRKQLSDSCRKEELLLEEKESDSIELNVSLLKACKDERQLFCSTVTPGAARVFRCLAENMNDADFGSTCRYQIIYKLQRRQSNWKLDPPLRKACKTDVLMNCNAEDAQNSEEGLVYKCMIGKYELLTAGCQKELGRAVHMAFFAWQRGAILTAECDDDIEKLCLIARPNMGTRPGAVGTCLAQLLEKQDSVGTTRRQLPESKTADAAASIGSGATAATGQLSGACFRLADIAEPPNMKQAFESSLSFALLTDQLAKIELTTGLPTVTRDRRGQAQGVSLTGWMAMLGMSAMIGLILYGVYYGYKRFRGVPEKDYTLVVKAQHK